MAHDARTRFEEVRFEILDRELNLAGEIHPDLSSPPTLSNATGSGAVFRTLRGFVLRGSEVADFDRAADRVRVRYRVDDLERSMGVLRFGSGADYDAAVGRTLEGTLVDLGVALSGRTTEAVGFSRGYPVVDALEQVIERTSIAEFRIDASGATLGEPIGWAPGATSWSDIAKAIAASGGYLPPYFDSNGVWRVRQSGIPAGTAPDLSYEHPAESYYAGGLVRSLDFVTEPNVWIVLGSGAETVPLLGRYELPPSAESSPGRLGYEIPEVTTVQGLQDATAALAAAEADAAAKANAGEPAELTAPIDPRHDTFDLVEADGVVYREVGWSTALAAGAEMRHDLVVAPLPVAAA